MVIGGTLTYVGEREKYKSTGTFVYSTGFKLKCYKCPHRVHDLHDSSNHTGTDENVPYFTRYCYGILLREFHNSATVWGRRREHVMEVR